MQTIPSLLGSTPRSIAVALVATLLTASSLTAAEAPAAKKDAKKEEAPVVFTNKTLEQLPPPPPPTALGHLSEPAQPTTGGAASVDEPGVFTNETLEKLFGPSTPPPPPPAADAKPPAPPAGTPGAQPAVLDPLAAIQKEKEDAAKLQQATAESQRELAAAEEKVREMEQRLLAQRNPYLPKPKLTPEEEAKQQGLDGAARVQRTQEELELARKELERARAQAGQSAPRK